MIKIYLKHLFLTAEKNLLRNLSKSISFLTIDKFLDIGCYDGSNTIRMAQACHAKEIYGIEINREAIKLASLKGIKIIRQDANKEKWSIEDNSFDFVYANQIIEHLYSVDNFIMNIKRILKKIGMP